MRCQNCDHDNPSENRFCGMCGTALAGKTADEQAVGEVPQNLLWEPVTSEEQASAPFVAQEIESRREPGKAEPAAVAPPTEPERRNDKWWVDERETTVAGPSFLGLSSAESGDGGGYSYLFQDEPERSHKGLWVLLLVLVALGGALYAKWQPIRDYVLTTAITHSRPKPAAAQQPSNATGPQKGATQAGPTTTLASSDAPSPPAIATENKPAANAKEGLPGGDKDAAAGAGKNREGAAAAGPKASSTDSKGGDTGPKQPGAKSQAPAKDVASADDASATDGGRPSAAVPKKTRAAPVNEGGELVSSGEKYLYGRGVARSCDQAVSYFNAAAAKQNSQAYSHLGALYATGECVPMDRAAAYGWFRRAYAKEPTNHYFEQNLTMLWREMTPDERQRATGKQ